MGKKSKSLSETNIGIMDEKICPLMSIGIAGGRPCIKNKCEFWMELTSGHGKDARQVGRCALSWIPFVTIQLRETVERFEKKV